MGDYNPIEKQTQSYYLTIVDNADNKYATRCQLETRSSSTYIPLTQIFNQNTLREHQCVFSSN